MVRSQETKPYTRAIGWEGSNKVAYTPNEILASALRTTALLTVVLLLLAACGESDNPRLYCDAMHDANQLIHPATDGFIAHMSAADRDPSVWNEPRWIAEGANVAGDYQAYADAIRAVQPPSSAQEIHDIMLQIAAHNERFGVLYRESLETGDQRLILIATAELVSSTDLIETVTPLVQDYCGGQP